MKTKDIISILVSVSFVTACATEVVVSPSVNEIPTSTSSLEQPPTKAESTGTPIPTSTKSYPLADIPICPKSGVEIPPSNNFGIPGTIVYQKD